MANKCDSNIYGADDNAFASRIASDSLDTSQGSEDIWGALTSNKQSKGVKGLEEGGETPTRSLSKDTSKAGDSKGN